MAFFDNNKRYGHGKKANHGKHETDIAYKIKQKRVNKKKGGNQT